ncbi:S1C family serine protease [Stratiformator vulcanicus]|uniref:Periplasmic serine endoprotease DegP n=1 Tax=Stratiformator vulcanicus TaxID=2527980 RepID=A0A517R0M1_9PLAN|nr:trypsin-like peptidase domain-containing protein [Stratiformator vulcanicus]QDT37384.1 Periplasmic serine endoprotease DegP precursor [Stratiformator vulcanicus]
MSRGFTRLLTRGIGSVLTLGVGIGLGIVIGQGLAPTHATTLSFDEAARLYADLDGETRPLVDGGTALAKVARLTSPAVVHIQSRRKDSRGGSVEETGSGVIMRHEAVDGAIVVTNRHVIAGSAALADISVGLSDGRTVIPVRTWEDAASDIAVLQLKDPNVPPAAWGDSEALDIGHFVLALGSPFGLSQSVTLGIVSAKGRRSLELGSDSGVLNKDFIQTDAAINPGNSGGPLVDLRGRVIGINTAIASNSGGNEGIGFSIPSNLARRVVDQLVTHGRVNRSFLGVKLDPDFNPETARRFNLDRVRGARVVLVYDNTPAAKARLQRDDVILRFGEIDVQDENHLINLVSLTPVGKRIDLKVYRDGRMMTLRVELADRASLAEK